MCTPHVFAISSFNHLAFRIGIQLAISVAGLSRARDTAEALAMSEEVVRILNVK